MSLLFSCIFSLFFILSLLFSLSSLSSCLVSSLLSIFSFLFHLSSLVWSWCCWWSWCVFGVCVCCGMLKKRGKNRVWIQKRLRVYIRNVPRLYGHHAHMCFNMCAWCRYTRGRFERTHTGSRVSSSVLLTKICLRKVITCFRGSPKKLLDLSHFQV